MDKFEIQITGPGKGKFLLNDEDISEKVARAYIDSGDTRTVPSVMLQMNTSDCKLEGEGVIYIQPTADPILNYISRFTAKDLENMALERMGQGDANMSVVESVINLLREVGSAAEPAAPEDLH